MKTENRDEIYDCRLLGTCAHIHTNTQHTWIRSTLKALEAETEEAELMRACKRLNEVRTMARQRRESERGTK